MRKRLVITFPSNQLDFRALNNIRNMEECLQAPSIDLSYVPETFQDELKSVLSASSIDEVSLILSSDSASADMAHLSAQLSYFNGIPAIAAGLKSGALTTNAFLLEKESGDFNQVVPA